MSYNVEVENYNTTDIVKRISSEHVIIHKQCRRCRHPFDVSIYTGIVMQPELCENCGAKLPLDIVNIADRSGSVIKIINGVKPNEVCHT